jgi:hypothetical protein
MCFLVFWLWFVVGCYKGGVVWVFGVVIGVLGGSGFGVLFWLVSLYWVVVIWVFYLGF